MRISDWSSDLCSSDLVTLWAAIAGSGARGLWCRGVSDTKGPFGYENGRMAFRLDIWLRDRALPTACRVRRCGGAHGHEDRKRVVGGRSGSERLELGGGRIITKKQQEIRTKNKN